MQIYEEKSAEFIDFAREMRGFQEGRLGLMHDLEVVRQGCPYIHLCA